MKELRSLDHIKKEAKNLIGDGENIEYTRGICELLADIDGLEGANVCCRALGVAAELTGKAIDLYKGQGFPDVAFYQPDDGTIDRYKIPFDTVWKDPAKLMEKYPNASLLGFNVVDIEEPTFADLSLEEAIDHMKSFAGNFGYLVDELEASS